MNETTAKTARTTKSTESTKESRLLEARLEAVNENQVLVMPDGTRVFVRHIERYMAYAQGWEIHFYLTSGREVKWSAPFEGPERVALSHEERVAWTVEAMKELDGLFGAKGL